MDFTKSGEEVFDPLDGLGAARGADMGEAQTWAIEVESAIGGRNLLVNPDGFYNQRVATSQTDDSYAWDCHYVLTQTAAVGVSSVANVADGLPSMMRLTQSQVTAQRMGLAQIVESANAVRRRGKAVTLIGKMRCSASQPIRYAILEWTGTADAPVSDVVNSWTNATFTAGQFFNSTTLNLVATGAITPPAGTVKEFKLKGSVGSTANNLIVFIWTEGTAAQNVTLDVAWELITGSATALSYPVDPRPRTLELLLCQRYCWMSYDIATAPGTATLNGAIDTTIPTAGTGAWHVTVRFPVPMVKTPTITAYDNLGASGVVFRGAAGKTASVTATTTGGTNVGTTDTTSATQLMFHVVAKAEL